jgi:hypothetical protein
VQRGVLKGAELPSEKLKAAHLSNLGSDISQGPGFGKEKKVVEMKSCYNGEKKAE